jgi:signal transduction histidine kinase
MVPPHDGFLVAPGLREPDQRPSWFASPETVLGLRMLALAVVAGAAVFLPPGTLEAGSWIPGILAGAALGVVAMFASRGRLPARPELIILAQVGVWTYLTGVSGGLRSPLTAGYLLEVVLAGAWLGRRGVVVAAGAGALLILGSSLAARPLRLTETCLALGFLALTAAIARWTVADVERQRRRIAESHAALGLRAQCLAEELRLLGDYLDGALLVIDDLGRVVSVNGAGFRLLGREPRGSLGEAWQGVLEPDASGLDAISQALAGGGSRRSAAFSVGCSGGGGTPVRAGWWTSETPDGPRAYLLLQPATAHEPADPVRRLGEAAACVSHQIRSALGTLQGYAEGVERALGSDPAPSEAAGHFVRALRSLGELAENILALAGAPSAPASDVSLAETVASAVLLAGPSAGRVRLLAEEGEIRVRTLRGPLVHAVFNLLDNACRETPQDRDVSVRIGRRAGRAMVEVADGGPGLPPAREQATSPLPSKSGCGLGVIAARRFVEACGGSLEFEHPTEGGTRARIILAADGAVPR